MSDYFALVWKHLPTLLEGAGVTLIVSGITIALGVVFGLALCFGLISDKAVVRRLCLVYQSFWRGTPILVQLFIVYYLLPVIGFDVAPIVAAIAALTMNTTAFQSEIYRGGLQTISAGQFEAARIHGLGVWTTRRRILVPQMFRLVLPALVNETISILKNSSLVSVIAVTELMRVSQQIVATNYRAFEMYFTAGVMYLIMNLTLSFAARYAERRMAVAG